jgi:undecaprenyl-diphosphatase
MQACKLRSVPRPNFRITRYVLIALASVLAFLWLAATALEDTVPPFDAALRSAVHLAGSPALTAIMKVVTNLGSGWFLWPVGVLIVIWLERTGRRRDAARLAAAVLGANGIDQALKLLFHRVRPEAYFGYAQPSTYSFPSGHAFVSCCFYLAVAEVLIRPAWPRWKKRVVWTAAVMAIIAIGFSRVYLGVHYPTDVLAGYAGAIAWMTVVRTAHILRRAPEPAADPGPPAVL